LLQSPGGDVAKLRLARSLGPIAKNYGCHACLRPLSVLRKSRRRGLTPLWVGVAIYAPFVLAGNRLLIIPMWQITVGQWILAELKKYHFIRVFNDHDFGGYLIANGVAPFIDGRTELYGEKFFVDHNAASGLIIATIHDRKQGAVHTVEPVIRRRSNVSPILTYFQRSL
jgi:hypothetical protein